MFLIISLHIFHTFFHTCNFFTCDTRIRLQRVASLLCPNFVCVNVEDKWGTLVLYPSFYQ